MIYITTLTYVSFSNSERNISQFPNNFRTVQFRSLFNNKNSSYIQFDLRLRLNTLLNNSSFDPNSDMKIANDETLKINEK